MPFQRIVVPALLLFGASSAAIAGGEVVSRTETVRTERRAAVEPPPYPPELEARYQAMKASSASGVGYASRPAQPYSPCAPYGVPGGFGYNGSDYYPNLGMGISGSGGDYRIIGLGATIAYPFALQAAWPSVPYWPGFLPH